MTANPRHLPQKVDVASQIAACYEAIASPHLARNWIVAVSGGPDSVALMLYLKDEAKRFSAQLSAVIVDHNLRPESAMEAEQVAQRCHQFGVQADILTITDTPPHHGKPEWARQQRYDLLCAYARSRGGVLWLGHHLQDQQETIAMRLSKGSGLYGLMAMQRHSYRHDVLLLRPLLNVPKSQLQAYCDERQFAVVDDPSNHKMIYERTRWRGILAQDKQLSHHLSHLGALATRAEACLSTYLQEFCDRYLTIEAHQFSCHLSASAFDSLSAPAQIMLTRRLIGAVGQPNYAPSFAAIEEVCDRLRCGKTATLAYCVMRRHHDKITFLPEAGRPHGSIQLRAGGNYVYQGRFIIYAKQDTTLWPMTKKRWQYLDKDNPYRAILMSYPEAVRMIFPYPVGLDEQPITPHIINVRQMDHFGNLDDATEQVAIVPIARLARMFVSDTRHLFE